MLETPPTLSDLIRKLAIVDTSDECLLVAADLAALVHKNGLSVLPDVLAPLLAYCANKKSGLEREGGFLAIAGLVQALGKPCEPYMLPLLPVLMDGYQDKGLPVRQAAELAATNIVALCDPLGVELVLPSLYQATTRKWQVKIAACKHLENLAILSPQQVGYKLPELIPVVSEVMHEIRAEVSQAAIAAMMEICKIVGNPDIEQHIPLLVDCMAHPDHVSTAVQTLSSTTFVAEVTGPALGIMVPLLVRALNDRSAAVLRSSVVIANNLFKLVRNPEDAGQFMSQLLPGLERIIDTAAYPEVRTLASEAKATLVKAAGGEAGHEYIKKVIVPVESIQKLFKAALVKKKVLLSAAYDPTFYHVSFLVSELLKAEIYERSEWTRVLAPYLETIISNSNAESLLDSVHLFYNDIYNEKQKLLSGDDDADGELLCNCQFSLAYGGMMLLNHTRLRLRRGQRYGLCAHNGAGKSTLLRAISLGKVEGFPGEDEVKTVFVEHKLQGVDASLSVLDFLAHDPKLADLDRSEIASALEDVGFGDDKQSQPVGALSGGWKMKLELARAILIKADILLLDEPTNHLDVANIAWLENYLNTQTEITSIIVSHDSAFLDNVCTYIIHYESKKLVYYKGNLSKFVEKKPEAKSYYTLAATTVKFSFPPPSILLGIRSNTKAILKMVDGTFTYPGAPKPSMKHVSVQLSLSSRVGIVGPNGAGKSTMIKLLTGELIPQTGTVWKHPNIRVGYVAQHAFHHLEEHLEKTPNQYIQWRYQGGQDREVCEKATRKLTAEDLAQMDVPIVGANGEQRRLEDIIGRQKLKKTFQYEVKWVGYPHKHNKWMSREVLLEAGFQKLVQAFDDQEASREGQQSRELIPSVIRQHIEDVGLPGDIADNNTISGLSGGQKVKVVLAAAMWNNPHMLVLDEPTNYLDREALGGLAVAIRDWTGAVVMISHHTEFVQALCPELWHVDNGTLTRKGESAVNDEHFADSQAKIAKATSKPKKKKLNRNELKEQVLRRRSRYLKWIEDGGQFAKLPREPDTESD